ncbi:MFS general substrate transporter [Gautieria morchelliformis]|nr:MFS general substrate transporter [Gautieria morchelliformis]
MALPTTNSLSAPSSASTLTAPPTAALPVDTPGTTPSRPVQAASPAEPPEQNDKLARERQADSDAAWDVEPANPRNWSFRRKWTAISIVSLYTFVAPLASSMMAPGLPEIATRYSITNPSLVALTLSIYLLAFAIGPFLVGPLSEMYGRTWVLHCSNLFFLVFSMACIFAPTAGSLTGFRFLAGLGGCTPVSIGGGSVSDLFSGRDRGTAMSIYSMGPLVGPVLGPIAGGFIVQTIGIKWIFIMLTILACMGALVGIPLLEETYAPVIKERLNLLRRQDMEAGEKVFLFEVPVRPSLGQSLLENLSRPFMLLTRSLICFMLSLYLAVIYGYLYLMFTTFPDLFSGIYGWGPGISGLAYLGPGLGFMTATLIGIRLLSVLYVTLSERNGGKGKPEFRIPVMFLGSIFVPVGLFWYGWSAQARIHWIMPIIGSSIFSAGLMFVYTPIQLYLVDAFTYAASALSAASVFRAVFGFAFPLFGEQMFAALGFGGGNSLLAGIAIVTGIPFPIWLYYKGEQMRLRNR